MRWAATRESPWMPAPRTPCAGARACCRQASRAVAGNFRRGDAVRIVGPDGAEIAIGLIAYDADAARRIAGRQSGEIEALLGYKGRDVLVHRDDMVERKNLIG